MAQFAISPVQLGFVYPLQLNSFLWKPIDELSYLKEIDQQPIVVVNQKHRTELKLTLSLTRLGDYCVRVLLDFSLLQSHTVAQ